MSTPLKGQLRDYFTYLEERQQEMDSARSNGVRAVDQSQISVGEVEMVELDTDQPTNARRPPFAIAATVLVIAGIGLVAFFVTKGDDPPAPAARTQTFGIDSALETADSYFAARAAGDADAVLSLFTDDAAFSSNFSAEADRTRWELDLAWDLAQGGSLSDRVCTVGGPDPGVEVTVSCEFGTLDSLGLAVGATRIPTSTEMTITADGIRQLDYVFGIPDFTATGSPFTGWMQTNHPQDAEATGCCAGTTIEESIARGELRARYASEWAAYLEANGCDYRQPLSVVIAGGDNDGEVVETC